MKEPVLRRALAVVCSTSEFEYVDGRTRKTMLTSYEPDSMEAMGRDAAKANPADFDSMAKAFGRFKQLDEHAALPRQRLLDAEANLGEKRVRQPHTFRSTFV